MAPAAIRRVVRGLVMRSQVVLGISRLLTSSAALRPTRKLVRTVRPSSTVWTNDELSWPTGSARMSAAISAVAASAIQNASGARRSTNSRCR